MISIPERDYDLHRFWKLVKPVIAFLKGPLVDGRH